MMVCLLVWFVYCFIRLVVIGLTRSFVIIAHCFDCYFCKILHFEIFCVGVRYCKICIIWKTVLLEKLRFFFFWKTVILEKLRYFENLRYWKTVLLEKLFRLDKLCYLKTALLENWFALKNCDTWETVILESFFTRKLTCFWITMLLEKFLRWGALLVKFALGCVTCKILLYCKILRCLKIEFLWKLRY